MIDLPKKLRITAGVINMGGRIAWGSDTALMEEAAGLIEQQQAEANALKAEVSELKSELNCRSNTIIELESGLNSVNEYKDKLTAAVSVLVDQCKSGEVSLGAIYDVDILLGE